MKKLTIMIPCHNEEKGIEKVIDAIPVAQLSHLGFEANVLVIDNASTDKTAEVAKRKNATVITEKKKGKGNAILAGFAAIPAETEYVVMLDGDNTYKSYEIPRLVEPLTSEFCDVVVGSRLSGKLKQHSLRLQNRIANWGYTFLIRQLYKANITDVLSGYFAWKREVIEVLMPHLKSEGFEIEMEMITKMVRLGFELCSVPITYDQREGQTKVQAITDGLRILRMYMKNLYWTHPDKRKKRRKPKNTANGEPT